MLLLNLGTFHNMGGLRPLPKWPSLGAGSDRILINLQEYKSFMQFYQSILQNANYQKPSNCAEKCRKIRTWHNMHQGQTRW